MARGTLHVTCKGADEARIPDKLTEGAVVLADLRRSGLLDGVGERVHIRRQGGYCGLDVWILLLLFYAAGAVRGFRKFWEDELRPVASRVAAVAGRRQLPSSASLSRALDAVELELLRPSAPWLLVGGKLCDEVLDHPVVRTRDAVGEDWHVFHFDPTNTTLRHRALPVDDELPEPRRRSEETGAPGHTGRKRGDIVHRRVTVQHAGSGIWVHAHLSPGNGDGVVDLDRGLDTVAATCQRLNHPLSRALVCMDGEHGHVPWFAACREHGLPFLTRLNRPKLLETPEVLARLRSAKWYRVPDSLSGPRRSAADLGVLTIKPGKRTRRPDGGVYEPITVRVVASVFENPGKAKRGRILDGRQVELFAIDAPADAWPAPEVVAAYFGRTAEENRFAQDDRELGLDRIVSYHLPGQELAALVGLFLWNLRVVRGFAQTPPPQQRPAQPLRCAPVDDSIPAQWPRDPVLCARLAEVDSASALAKRPGWRLDPSTGELQCPEGRCLTLTTVRAAEHADGRTGIIFRRPSGGCEDCVSRTDCLDSHRPFASKHAELSVATSLAAPLRERLAEIRSGSPEPATVQPITAAPGAYAVADALFLPAAARQAFLACFAGATLRIEVELPEPAAPRPRLVAADVADRQRRRKTWAQNVERYALPAEARVHFEVAGTAALHRLLGGLPSERSPAVAAG